MDRSENVILEKRKPYSPNRSCERCRSLKIKCIPENHAKCQRCARLGIECTYALPARRKPRKRTDAKVAELEKEVRALSSIVRKQQDSSTSATKSAFDSSPSSASPNTSSIANEIPEFASPNTEALNLSTTTSENRPTNDSSFGDDVIDSGIVPKESAAEIFHLFRTCFLPKFPILAVKADADEVRSSRPLLYLAILAAAASCVDPSLGKVLNKKITSTIAELGMVQGVKSLDLLQAILVTTTWHFPENSFDHLKYHQYAHLAAGMASYVGIEGRRLRRMCSNRNEVGGAQPPMSSFSVGQLDEVTLLDQQRTLLACYLLCSGISRSLHRPTIVPWTSYMERCIENLSNSEHAADTDKQLIIWIQLQRVMTEASTALGIDDVDVLVDLSEPRLQKALTFYDAKLQSFYPTIHELDSDGVLHFNFYTNLMSLHEISMYAEHDPDDFHPPYSIERITRSIQHRSEITPAHMQSMSITWSSAVQALERFLGFTVEVLRCSPTVVFVRMIYGATIIVKLLESAKSSEHYESLFDREKAMKLIERLIIHVKDAGECGFSPVAERFALGLERMQAWCLRQLQSHTNDTLDVDLLEPLRNMELGTTQEDFNFARDGVSEELDCSSTLNSVDQKSYQLQGQTMIRSDTENGVTSFGNDFDFTAWDELEWIIPSELTFDLLGGNEFLQNTNVNV